VFFTDSLADLVVHPTPNIERKISAQNTNAVYPDEQIGEFFHLNSGFCITLCADLLGFPDRFFASTHFVELQAVARGGAGVFIIQVGIHNELVTRDAENFSAIACFATTERDFAATVRLLWVVG
jgi:hypothetical protein